MNRRLRQKQLPLDPQRPQAVARQPCGARALGFVASQQSPSGLPAAKSSLCATHVPLSLQAFVDGPVQTSEFTRLLIIFQYSIQYC